MVHVEAHLSQDTSFVGLITKQSLLRRRTIVLGGNGGLLRRRTAGKGVPASPILPQLESDPAPHLAPISTVNGHLQNAKGSHLALQIREETFFDRS